MDEETNGSAPKKAKLEKCARCSKSIKKISGVPKYIESSVDAQAFEGVQFHIGDVICSKCRKALRITKDDDEKTNQPVQQMDCTAPKVSNISEVHDTVEQHILQHDDQASAICQESNENILDRFSIPEAKESSSSIKCIKCGKFIIKVTGTAKIVSSLEEAKVIYDSTGIYAQVGDSICSKCRSIYRKMKSEQNQSEQQVEAEVVSEIEQDMSEVSIEFSQIEDSSQSHSNLDTASVQTKSESQSACTSSLMESQGSDSTYYESEPQAIETVELPFPRTVITHAYCFICGPDVIANLCDVPFTARLHAFVTTRIFIPKRNRCCKIHLIKNRFYADELTKIPIFSYETSIEITEVKIFLDSLSDKADARLHDKIGEQILSEERIKALTGYTWDNIIKLKSMAKNIRISANRDIIQAITIFLMKLRSGNSNNCIAAILEIEESVVDSSILTILRCFREEILPKHFGIGSHDRNFLMNQSSAAARKLYDLENHLAIICDGSYLRHQKSSNNSYQRKSYSGQKKVPLCKPFTVCTTNGFVIECAGPFYANMNDAQILEEMLKDDDGLSKILRPGDIFILDRGFRDVVSFLEEQGYEVHMPALKGKRNQLTTEESNASRFVTKIRWVVEAVHGIIGQKAKLLHHQFSNQLLEHAGTFCKVANLLHNLFGKRLNSDDEQLELIIERMKYSKDLKNTLAEEVESNNWNRKSVPFSSMSSEDLLDFPEISDLEDLKLFFTGSYQLSQAVSYLAEILQDDDTLELKYNKVNPSILRFEVRSRHINSKTYKCYVHYEKNAFGIDGIKRYCCNCANGNRTVGCCSHIAAIIYYLSYARFLSKIIRPADHLMKLFDCASLNPVIDEDSDED